MHARTRDACVVFRIYPCLSRAHHDSVEPITKTACIFLTSSQPSSQPATAEPSPAHVHTVTICQNAHDAQCWRPLAYMYSSQCKSTRSSVTTHLSLLPRPAVKLMCMCNAKASERQVDTTVSQSPLLQAEAGMKHGLLIIFAAREIDKQRHTSSIFPFGQAEGGKRVSCMPRARLRCLPQPPGGASTRSSRHIAGIL